MGNRRPTAGVLYCRGSALVVEWRAPQGRIQGAATKAMPRCIGEERQRSRRPCATFGCGGRVATGSREFSIRHPRGPDSGLESSRPPFAKRTPAADSQPRHPHPFFGSLLPVAEASEAETPQFSRRQAISTRTGISFLTVMAKSEGGSILKAANVVGIVPDIRVVFF